MLEPSISLFSAPAQVVALDRATNSGAATFTVTRDALAPAVTVEAVPGETTIDVTWSATDSGSGVAHYDLDVSVDGGDWESLLANTQSTAYQYPNDPGHEYTFRVTATDRVGNVGQAQASAIVTAVTKYYYFGAKRVAMRGPDDALVWLHGDHLGSTSLATSAAQAVLSRQLYYPFGGTRWTSVASLPTDFQFTGQRIQSTIALYDYRARFYDPYVGRFIQADTIVPEPGNPQDFNRYSYVRNNPLKFTDPSGHQCTIEYDPFTGSYGGKSCFGDQTGMGRTQEINEKNPGSGCRSAAECKENEGKLVKLIWSLLVISFAPGAAAEAGLIGTGGTVAAQEFLDGDDDELRVIQGIEQLVERGIGGGGGSGQFVEGFTQSEIGTIRSIAERFSGSTGIDVSSLQYWRYDYGITGYAASGSPAGIAFTDDFFTLSESGQLYVFAEEYLHVLQGLTEFGPDTAATAHEEIQIVLDLLLSLE